MPLPPHLSLHSHTISGYLPNSSIALEAMLAAASLGAAWTSTSPDFGVTVSEEGEEEQKEGGGVPRMLILSPFYSLLPPRPPSGCVGQVLPGQAEGDLLCGGCEVQQ